MDVKTIIAVFLISSSLAFSQTIARVETIKISSMELKQEREILVYTPQGYDEALHTRFDVIYVFDCQNREFFDYAHSTLSFLEEFLWKKFIVVGITSPYNEDQDYDRNNDLLPVLKSKEALDRYPYSGNADNFLKYLKNEVSPYVDKNYRTMNKRIAVGHSLGASFILYSLFNEPDLFTDYIAISPNLAYDQNSLAKQFLSFDFNQLAEKKFLYLSSANEGQEYWQHWKPARKLVHQFLKDSVNGAKLALIIKEYPQEGHLNVFPKSYQNGIDEYLRYFAENYNSFLSKDTFKVTIRLTVPNKNDSVYMTGNQGTLSNWELADKVQFNKISDYQRELTLNLQSPLQFKLTRGSWDTEALVKGNDAMKELSLNMTEDMEVHYDIINWDDNIE
jgi:predicted alpha/beta superfamily hydrolase